MLEVGEVGGDGGVGWGGGAERLDSDSNLAEVELPCNDWKIGVLWMNASFGKKFVFNV